MKAALVQFNSVWESRDINLERAASFAREAAQEHCDVVVFPELFATGFSMNIPLIADEGYGKTASYLATIARENSINLIAGLAMRVPGEERARNMAVVYDRKGRPTATYTKTHLFPLAGEDMHFIPGSSAPVFSIDTMPCSVFICYDLRFPELFRTVARQVTALFVIANWPSERKEHWEALLKARAIENQCFVIGVNRTGTDGNNIRYPGASRIFDPLGNCIGGGDDAKEFITAEFDPGETDRVRSAFPFLKDMKEINQ